MLVAEREARKSEAVLQEYEAVEAVEYGARDWMAVTGELQQRIAAGYCSKQGLPAELVPLVVRKMRVAVHKEPFADVGLPQQWPINRARRGNLALGESAPIVTLRPVLSPPAAGVGQALQFPREVCQKKHTVVIAGSYS